MPPAGLVTAVTSLMLNCLAVATTLDASARATDRYAAVVGEDPSMTHTSSPPSRALPILSVCRSSRGDIPAIDFPGFERLDLQQRGRLAIRIQPKGAVGCSGRQLRKARTERSATALKQGLNADCVVARHADQYTPATHAR